MVKQTSAAMKPTVHRRVSGTRNLPHMSSQSQNTKIETSHVFCRILALRGFSWTGSDMRTATA